MLAFGEQLYRMTTRDEEGILVEPFFRNVIWTLGAGLDTQTTDFSVPLDRALYIDSIQFNLSDTPAGSTWTRWALVAVNPTGNYTHVLATESLNVAVSTQWVRSPQLKLVVPPQIGTIRFLAFRTGLANAVNGSNGITAYLIPPGRIGRV